MVLLIDAGNTRIKWARCVDGRLGRSRAAAHGSWSAGDFARRLFGARTPQQVLVASVAGTRVRAALTQAARRAHVPLEFVRVPRRGGGVTVGYLEPWRLGVDRYAGLVGAHALFAGVPLLVTGVGTALTLDLLGEKGRHFGGAIIPSPALMVQSLLERTQGIRRRAHGGARRAHGPFGRSTRAAITEGARFAAAAAIDRVAGEGALHVGRRPLVVLTGGGAVGVRPLLESPCVSVPDLVLIGLAALAAGRAMRP
ncbi:MAG TPA: type III pantothenate kinase [Steroidobacteraceae bacterium]|nr:type III pantothenate kinase [Steroidobacteraceae bacterium]